MLIRNTCHDQRETCKAAPYTGAHTILYFISRYSCIDYSYEFIGSVLVRFERSTLPEHEGARTVVLWILKIITPMKSFIPLYDGYISCPKEGDSKLQSFTKFVVKCGVSVLTHPGRKVLEVWSQVFNYFGMHNYFTHICFYLVLIGITL